MQTELEFADLPQRLRRGPGPGAAGSANQTVGRAEELRRLQECADRRQDVLLLGPAGVGKSHLLAQVRGARLVRIRSLSPARQTLLDIAEALFDAGVLRVQPTAGPKGTRPAVDSTGMAPDAAPVAEVASPARETATTTPTQATNRAVTAVRPGATTGPPPRPWPTASTATPPVRPCSSSRASGRTAASRWPARG